MQLGQCTATVPSLAGRSRTRAGSQNTGGLGKARGATGGGSSAELCGGCTSIGPDRNADEGGHWQRFGPHRRYGPKAPNHAVRCACAVRGAVRDGFSGSGRSQALHISPEREKNAREMKVMNRYRTYISIYLGR